MGRTASSFAAAAAAAVGVGPVGEGAGDGDAGLTRGDRTSDAAMRAAVR